MLSVYKIFFIISYSFDFWQKIKDLKAFIKSTQKKKLFDIIEKRINQVYFLKTLFDLRFQGSELVMITTATLKS